MTHHESQLVKAQMGPNDMSNTLFGSKVCYIYILYFFCSPLILAHLDDIMPTMLLHVMLIKEATNNLENLPSILRHGILIFLNSLISGRTMEKKLGFMCPSVFLIITNNFCSMKWVEANAKWSLFHPNEAAGLYKVHSEGFEALYHKYKRESHACKMIPAKAFLKVKSKPEVLFANYKFNGK